MLCPCGTTTASWSDAIVQIRATSLAPPHHSGSACTTLIAPAAQQMKARPVFLERMPRADRNKAIAAALGRPEQNIATATVRPGLARKMALREFMRKARAMTSGGCRRGAGRARTAE